VVPPQAASTAAPAALAAHWRNLRRLRNVGSVPMSQAPSTMTTGIGFDTIKAAWYRAVSRGALGCGAGM